MQTQRDHVNAHQFLVGRMTSALVMGDPSTGETPARRSFSGLLIGMVLALLVAVGFGVYGALVPGGNTDWQEPGAILVEEETGTRYVYYGGQLRPTLNQASALLLQGATAHVVVVSQASLAGVPRGAAIGIPDAPQVVPEAANLSAGPWLLCATVPAGQSADTVSPVRAGAPAAEPGLALNLDPGARAEPLAANGYTMVIAPSGDQFLVWAGERHRVADPTVPAALGITNAEPIPVSQQWLRALRDGTPVGAPVVPGAGSAGERLAGQPRRVGQLFTQRAAGGAEQLFVLLRDGLAPIGRTDFALLAGRPGASAPVELTAADVTSVPRSADRSLIDRLPDVAGMRFQEAGPRGLCLRQLPQGSQVRSTVMFGAPSAGGVLVKPGSGMLVGAIPVDPVTRRPELFLITDQGVAYPLLDDATVSALGYGSRAPVAFPASLLATLPKGPTLRRPDSV